MGGFFSKEQKQSQKSQDEQKVTEKSPETTSNDITADGPAKSENAVGDTSATKESKVDESPDDSTKPGTEVESLVTGVDEVNIQDQKNEEEVAHAKDSGSAVEQSDISDQVECKVSAANEGETGKETCEGEVMGHSVEGDAAALSNEDVREMSDEPVATDGQEGDTDMDKVGESKDDGEIDPEPEETVSSVGVLEFVWEHGGESVGVKGSFNDWSQEIALASCDGVFKYTLNATRGEKYYYKYVVDGQEMANVSQEIENDCNIATVA